MPPQTPVSTQHVPVVPTPMPASHDQIHANATGSGVRSSVAGSLHHSSDFVQIAAPATHALDHSFSGHARSQDAVYDSRAHVQSSLFESPASSRGSSAEMIRTSSVPYAAGEPLQTAHASSSSSYMMHSTNSQLGAGSSDSQQSFAANVDTMRAGSSTALTSVSIPERMEQMRKLSTTNPPAGSNKSSDPGGANRGRGASPLSKLSYNMNDVDTHSAESPRVSAVGNPNATVIPHQSALNMSTGMTRNLSDDNAARLPSSPTDGRISVSNARRSVDMGRAPQSPVSPSNATRGPSPVFRSATQPPTLTSNSGPNSGPGSGSGSGVFSPRTTSSADDSALSSNPVMEFIGEVGYWGGGGSSAILSYAKCDSSQSGMWFDGRISIPESQEDPPNSESSMEASFRSQPTQSQSQSQSQSQYLQQSQSSQSSQPVQQAQSSAGMHSSATREAPADLSQLTMMLDVYQAAMDRKAGVWNGIASSNSLMQPSDPSCHDDSYSNSRSSTGTPSRTPLSGNSTGSAPSPVPLTSKLHQRVIAKTANSGYSQQYTTSPGVPSPRQQSNTSLPGVRSSVSFHADNCMANDVTILDLLTGIGQIRRWTEAEIQSDVKAFESQRLRTVSDLFALSNSSWRGLPVPAIVKDSVRLALGMQIEDASTSTLEDSTATRAEQVV
ncbi:hypothetical protein BC831DRAFT_476540 [Entophlyctis helioformis]|nr:hypothetical protein BC831DRAFT_476540 [Entophlyctis helioformis]